MVKRTKQADEGAQLERLGHYIDGEHVNKDGRVGDIFNPSTGTIIKQVVMADLETIDRAVIAAKEAFQLWQKFSAIDRAGIMFQFKGLLEQHHDQIIRLITEEHGKVLDDAHGEFNRGLEIIEYACGAPELLKGEHSKNVGGNIDSWSEFHPLGVVLGITPFNFPVMVPMWMYPMALVCGNTFILKPSEKDPGGFAIYC